MDKTLIGVGGALIGLGAAFLVAGQVVSDLHPAFGTGGILWSVIGAITMGLGFKVRKSKIAQLDAMR